MIPESTLSLQESLDLAETLRLQVLSPADVAELAKHRDKLNAAQSAFDAKAAAQTALAKQWNERAAALEALRARLATAESDCEGIAKSSARIAASFAASLGTFGDMANPPAHLAREAVMGKLMLPLYRQALEKLRAEAAAETQALRDFGKANNIPAKFWPSPLS